ncbi:hypothetical protein GN956_G3168 [Arapaima gigas]
MHKLLSNIVLIAVISFAEDSVSPVLPKAVLTLQSGWTEIFTTERATLRETLGHTGVEDSIKTGLLPQ